MATSASGKTTANISLQLQHKALKINGILCEAYGAPFPFFSDKDPVSQLVPALVVDTHHFRVAERIGLIPPKSSLDKGARILAAYLPSDWDGQQVYDDHQAYMRHGQQVCHWSRPNCSHCIVRADCDYFKQEEKTA